VVSRPGRCDQFIRGTSPRSVEEKDRRKFGSDIVLRTRLIRSADGPWHPLETNRPKRRAERGDVTRLETPLRGQEVAHAVAITAQHRRARGKGFQHHQWQSLISRRDHHHVHGPIEIGGIGPGQDRAGDAGLPQDLDEWPLSPDLLPRRQGGRRPTSVGSAATASTSKCCCFCRNSMRPTMPMRTFADGSPSCRQAAGESPGWKRSVSMPL
jgi:hypothetical protein